METVSNMAVANTILNQLGGTGRLIVMIGAKDFTARPGGATFKWKAEARNDGINCLRISLNSADLYDLEFYRIWGTDAKQMGTISMVHFDQLVSVFESRTGLRLSL